MSKKQTLRQSSAEEPLFLILGLRHSHMRNQLEPSTQIDAEGQGVASDLSVCLRFYFRSLTNNRGNKDKSDRGNFCLRYRI